MTATAEKPAVEPAKPVDLRPLIAAEMTKPGFKTQVVQVPGTINYRVRWLTREGLEESSKFISAQQNGEKVVIVDRTNQTNAVLKETIVPAALRVEVKPEKKNPIDLDPLPTAERDD